MVGIVADQPRTVPAINISPPLLNSATPWATTLEDIRTLFVCPFTGALTTRTSLLNGFGHDPALHQYAFFDPVTHAAPSELAAGAPAKASLNTLGYSPLPLSEYLGFVQTISDGLAEPSTKLIVISVTGTPEEVAESYRLIAKCSSRVKMPLAMEINLSCPNIPNKPPPAYSRDSLSLYLSTLHDTINSIPDLARLPYGLKTPPYSYAGQYEALMESLTAAGSPCPVSFLTATNTLGSCLVLSDGASPLTTPRLPGTGIGGMAGVALHPLALGNVATLRKMLDRFPQTRHLAIIGVGGVEDYAGYRRMRSVGAQAVGMGTAYGRKGLAVFEEIAQELKAP